MDYGPAIPPHLGSDPHNASDQNANASEEPFKKVSDKPKKHCHSHSRHEVEPRSASDQFNDESDEPRIPSTKPKNMLIRVNIKPGPDMCHLPQRRISPLHPDTGLQSPLGLSSLGLSLTKTSLNMIQTPPYYREVALSDIPSQYAEEVDTFRRILSLPDPRESMPRSSTSVMGLDDEKGRQELRPRGPSSMLPLSSVIKDAFDKFEHDFQGANLPEGKYIKPPSTTKWYKVEQPCFEEKIQELNTDFAKILLLVNPLGLLWAWFPYQFLRNWNTKLGKISPRSTSLLPLQRLRLLAMLLLKSVNIA